MRRRPSVMPPSFFETRHPLLVSTLLILGLAAASLGIQLAREHRAPATHAAETASR